MNVLLISFSLESLNVRQLSSCLKEQNHQCHVHHYLERRIDQKDFDVLLENIKKINPELIGLSVLTDDFHLASILSQNLKKHFHVPIIWGGPHPSLCPEVCLKYADYACIHEGENALLELCNKLEANQETSFIQNLWTRKDNDIIKNPMRPLVQDLDALPFPDIDRSTQSYFLKGEWLAVDKNWYDGTYHIMTSRGCPYSCTFCYNSEKKESLKGLGKYLRQRSNASIIKELKKASEQYDIDKLYFWDDIFMIMNKSRVQQLSNEMNQFFNFEFFCMGEPGLIKEHVIKYLSECGLKEMQLGIQTGSERVNKEYYRRHHSNKHVINAARILKKYNVFVRYDIIFNNPYEDIEDIKDTIKLLFKLPKPYTLQGYNLIFFPKAELTQRALEDGYITPNYDISMDEIQGINNSPFSRPWNNTVSESYYFAHYETKHKDYYNALIILVQHYPKIIIQLLMHIKMKPLVAFLLKTIEIKQKIAHYYKYQSKIGKKIIESYYRINKKARAVS